jgi:hypothetical protein
MSGKGDKAAMERFFPVSSSIASTASRAIRTLDEACAVVFDYIKSDHAKQLILVDLTRHYSL